MSRLAAVALFCSLSAFAADNEVIDTPSAEEQAAPARCAPAIACSAKLAATDLVQVEAGSDGRTGDGELVHGGQMVVRYDLGAVGVEIYSSTLILPGTTPRSADGVQPGLKVALSPENGWLPASDLSVHLSVPTWNPDTTWDFEAWLYFSKTAGLLQANLNVMFALADLGGEPLPLGMATLTLAADLGSGVALFGELYGTWGQHQALPPGAGVFAGVSFGVTDELVVDVGSEVAFHGEPAVTVFAGLTFIPEGKQRPTPRLPASALALLDAP